MIESISRSLFTFNSIYIYIYINILLFAVDNKNVLSIGVDEEFEGVWKGIERIIKKITKKLNGNKK